MKKYEFDYECVNYELSIIEVLEILKPIHQIKLSSFEYFVMNAEGFYKLTTSPLDPVLIIKYS